MTKQPSASQVARAQRMRIAAEEGAKVRVEIQANDVAVRKNMERLRTLRLAKEAQEAASAPPPSTPRKAGKAKARATEKLSDWMKSQDGSGRKL